MIGGPHTGLAASPTTDRSWGASRYVHPIPSNLLRFLAETLLAERDRWLLWAPVGVACGIALYFALTHEPHPWLGAGFALVAALAALASYRRSPWFVIALGCVFVAGGFAIAQLRATLVAAPVLSERILPAAVSGRVVENAARAGDRRLVLDRVAIAGLDSAATPRRIRVNLRGGEARFLPGDWIAVRAGLLPPPPPSAPGAFDFARQAYFKRLGAVGFSLGRAHMIDPPPGEEGGGWHTAFGRLRYTVTARLLAAGEGQSAAVAAALLTGDRGAIADDVLDAMRDAGLAHLLAISGLHLGLVAGLVFFAVRALLALWETVALNRPIKKWAAGAALAATAFYLLLSGATIPTQRAFLMSGLVIVAILLDRKGVTMRSVAWAAIAVLAIHPESLLGPSFQMSFAAVVALVAVYESLRRRPIGAWLHGSARRHVVTYFCGVALMTLIAGAATAPFAIYHFNRIAVYGLAANLAAVPLTALWIMPWGVVSLMLMPLGLESWAVVPMGWGIDMMIAVANTVAGWPGAVKLISSMPMAGLALAAVGGLWLCLWRRRWRWLGALALVAGLLSPSVAQRPAILFDGGGKLMAARTVDGRLALSSTATARYAGEMWLRRNGQAISASWPGESPMLRCDSIACVYRAENRVISLVRDARAFVEDCRVVDAVLSTAWIRRSCPSAQVVISGADLWCRGAHALFFDGGKMRVESVAGRRGERPWSPRRNARC